MIDTNWWRTGNAQRSDMLPNHFDWLFAWLPKIQLSKIYTKIKMSKNKNQFFLGENN